MLDGLHILTPLLYDFRNATIRTPYTLFAGASVYTHKCIPRMHVHAHAHIICAPSHAYARTCTQAHLQHYELCGVFLWQVAWARNSRNAGVTPKIFQNLPSHSRNAIPKLLDGPLRLPSTEQNHINPEIPSFVQRHH